MDSMDGSVMDSMDRGVMGLHSHHGSWADPGVVTHHVGGVSHTLADLVALGGDHLLAVLYGRHVNMFSTHGTGYPPGDDNSESDSDYDWQASSPDSVCGAR